jgi:hypothetical protein
MGVTIPLKYLPCNKKNTGGNNEWDRREMAVYVEYIVMWSPLFTDPTNRSS